MLSSDSKNNAINIVILSSEKDTEVSSFLHQQEHITIFPWSKINEENLQNIANTDLLYLITNQSNPQIVSLLLALNAQNARTNPETYILCKQPEDEIRNQLNNSDFAEYIELPISPREFESHVRSRYAELKLKLINMSLFPHQKLIYNKKNIDLEKALKNEQFELYYQPQINLKTEEITGLEALIRWVHPKKGIILPDNFIPQSESNGLIHDIGKWVLKTACSELKQLHEACIMIQVAVNVSPVQIGESNFIDQVIDALTHAKLEAQYLELEITESTFQFSNQNIDNINKLRTLGVKIAIDDFGTGYSNLSSLNYLPMDVLKIDREFIAHVTHDNVAASLASSIINIGRIKNLKVLAEGIESPQQIQFLQILSCDYGQGYYIGKPMEFSQLIMFLKRYNQKNQTSGLIDGSNINTTIKKLHKN